MDEIDPKVLRRKLANAKIILFDKEGRILVLEEPRKSYLALPGGIGEAHESPRQTAIREVKEEIGLDITPSSLLCVDYSEYDGVERLNFTFLARKTNPDQEISFPDNEVAGYRFVSPHDLLSLTNPRNIKRMEKCLKAIEEKTVFYLESGMVCFS